MRAMQLLIESGRLLREAGITEPEKEAELILRETAGIERVSIFRDNPDLSDETVGKIMDAVSKRTRRMPIQYILGYAEFFGLRFKVGPGVLVPRPETEILVEEALKRASEMAPPVTVADLCTGSGAVAIAIALKLPDSFVYGTDISQEAIRYAEQNRALHGIGNVRFISGSLFEPLRGLVFDIIVSNPPYIKSSIIDCLEPEVKDWEPRSALDGGPDGLRFYREIFSAVRNYLKPNGTLLVEIADAMSAKVSETALSFGLKKDAAIKDYSGTERVLVFR